VEDRENWVDYAKAIGIILVVYGHVVRGLNKGGIDLPAYLYQLSDSIVYSFHMPLFFFLSGLFFYKSFSTKGATKLISSKVDTIFYPYIIWSMLQGGAEVFLSNYTNGNVSLNEVLSLLWSPRAQFWFLYALFFIFVLSSILYTLLTKIFTIPLFICSIVLYFYPSLLPDSYIPQVIAIYFVFFMLGIVFTMYFKVEYLSSFTIFIGLTISFVIGQWFFHFYLNYQYSNRGIELFVLTCVSIAFVISLSTHLSRANYRFIAYIGLSSMAIYVMHILAGSGTRVILNKIFEVDSFVIHLFVGCLVGVLAPLAVVYLSQKIKMKYLFNAPISYWCIKSYKVLNIAKNKLFN
jgi:fucose 4-O-acetylase-like acetyltransferase